MDPDRTDSQLDRLLGGKPDLGVSEREAIEEKLFEKLGPQTAAAPSRWRWLWAVGSVGAVTLAAFMLMPRAETIEELTPRGTAVVKPSFAVACIANQEEVPCARGTKLAFELTPQGYPFFSAVIEAPNGKTLWAYPRGDDGLSLDLRTAANGIVSDALLLDGPPGTYVVHGLFSNQPLNKGGVRQAMTTGTQGVELSEQQVTLP